MPPQWYLIQIDIQSTAEVNPVAQTNVRYWCMFLATHPEDKKRSDEFSRWWLECYRYTHCKESNDIVYGDHILIGPSSTPDSRKFIQWAMELQLIGHNNCNLVGPFNFKEMKTSNRMQQKVTRSHCNFKQYAILLECFYHHSTQTTTYRKRRIHKK